MNTRRSAATTYAYDADGNLTSATDAAGTTTYTYNAENQLTAMTAAHRHAWTYQYDAFGRARRDAKRQTHQVPDRSDWDWQFVGPIRRQRAACWPTRPTALGLVSQVIPAGRRTITITMRRARPLA